jgi:MSHA biogenesis protein MshG
MIALATEQRLSLSPLLQAFAADQGGVQRGRIQRLAELLDGGTSLPAALEQVAHMLPEEHVLAIRFGTQSGTLSMTLRNLVEDSGSLDEFRMKEQLQAAMVYPVTVLLVIVGIATFLLTEIWPVFQRIMDDFGVESSPLAFQVVIDVGNLFLHYWWLVAGVVLLLAWMLWTEKPGRSLRRGLVRPWCDMRTADVLQSLSVVTEAGRPIAGAISTLARYHHDPTLRQKLLFVCNEVEHGADLWATLQTVKLLTPAEVALMEASEKVGNRPWVMAQLASGKRRRMRRRLELLGQLVEPAVVLLVAGVVFTMCLGVFVPLAKMILYAA